MLKKQCFTALCGGKFQVLFKSDHTQLKRCHSVSGYPEVLLNIPAAMGEAPTACNTNDIIVSLSSTHLQLVNVGMLTR